MTEHQQRWIAAGFGRARNGKADHEDIGLDRDHRRGGVSRAVCLDDAHGPMILFAGLLVPHLTCAMVRVTPNLALLVLHYRAGLIIAAAFTVAGMIERHAEFIVLVHAHPAVRRFAVIALAGVVLS